MQAIAYEGYFDNGRFFTSGKNMLVPEQRRVVLTIFDERPAENSAKQEAWNDFKRMVKESVHENHLLDSDAFTRQDSGRELIDFSDGAI